MFVNAEGGTHPSEKSLREELAQKSRKSLESPVVGQELMFAALSNRAIHPEVWQWGAHSGRVRVKVVLTLEHECVIIIGLCGAETIMCSKRQNSHCKGRLELHQ